MMLDWLGDRHGLPEASRAGALVQAAVDAVLAGGARPYEAGGSMGTVALTEAVLAAVAQAEI
jgi:3-isopropylmalate dehydrogenase